MVKAISALLAAFFFSFYASQAQQQLLTALTNAGKDADLRIYPPGAHGAAYNLQSYVLISTIGFEFLERYLKGALIEGLR